MNLLFFLQRFKENKWIRGGLDPLLYPAKGFTLIEVIVSLVIMGISIVTILQLFSGGLRSIKVSDDYLRAAILAQNKMNELESKFNIFINQEGVFEQDDNYHWALSVENYDLAGLHPQFENLKDENTGKSIFVDKVKLKVFWNSEHGQREMELVTLKSSTTANQSSKDLLLGKYSHAFDFSRGLQFGEQNLPSGQSEGEYVQTDMSGAKYTVNKYISGAVTKGDISGN
ncbi:MAG TPA: type II secretion system protein [Nitrospinota bacterium]|jgi:general secretion pathway protein I|nr:type II secretion system protein [Nitrospinota bacterium]HJN03287.1 type II secretion system protein [Nitrospinota bacterium]